MVPRNFSVGGSGGGVDGAEALKRQRRRLA